MRVPQSTIKKAMAKTFVLRLPLWPRGILILSSMHLTVNQCINTLCFTVCHIFHCPGLTVNGAYSFWVPTVLYLKYCFSSGHLSSLQPNVWYNYMNSSGGRNLIHSLKCCVAENNMYLFFYHFNPPPFCS